jgi:hypothetical protein
MTDRDLAVLDAAVLGAALHDRVRDERPDLDRLVDRSAASGRRLRRRRRTGSSLAAVAGVAAVTTIGALVTGGTSPSTHEPDPAGRSTIAPSTGTLAPDPDPDPVTVDELQRLAERVRQAEQARAGDLTRLDQLLRLSDALRTADRPTRATVTRAERIAAYDDLREALRRLEGEQSGR